MHRAPGRAAPPGVPYAGGDEPALRDVTLRIRPGECIALVSSEGAGASTLLRVLAGLLPSYQGAVAFDDVSLRDLAPHDVHDRVALVASHVELLDGTLEENVTMGRTAVDADAVAWALRRAALAEVVHALPDGLRTRVGGAHRHPAQIERKLLLARAIATRPSLLMFDEFFHHLEPQAKRRLLGRSCSRRDPRCTIVRLLSLPYLPLSVATSSSCSRAQLLAIYLRTLF